MRTKGLFSDLLKIGPQARLSALIVHSVFGRIYGTMSEAENKEVENLPPGFYYKVTGF